MDRRRLRLHPAQRKVLAAKLVKNRIRETEYGAFQLVGCSGEWLAFPGFSWSPIGSRPPKEFFFSPREAYGRVFREVLEDDEDKDSVGVIILGPKGCGKSCILRAIAVELIGRLRPKYKVVCFWYLNARGDLGDQVRDALLFAFCDEGPTVMNQIEGIHTVADLSSFLRIRRESGDKIITVIDGEERYDVQHIDSEESTGRAAAKLWLETFEKNSCRIVKTLSPEANDARTVPELMKPFILDAKLGEEELEAFLVDNCPLLWRMLERHDYRWPDVRVHGGLHPMSLFLLNKACEDYVRLVAKVSGKRKALDLKMLDCETGKEIEESDSETVSLQDDGLEWSLDDDEDWQEVLSIFRKAKPFQEIRDYIVEKYRGEVERLRTPALVLKAYVDADGRFCTDFLFNVHMRACLERLKTNIFRHPTFVSYLRSKLRQPEITWAEVGWALEGFMADAIMALGLKLPEGKITPTQLKVLGGEPEQLDPGQLEVNAPVYLLPGKCSFKYVDGLLVWLDVHGVVHIVALQETVSPENHRGTEYKFMTREETARWYSGGYTMKYYYVYVCPLPTTKVLSARTADTVEYQRHELKLSECFEANMGQEELLVLSELGELRDKEVKRRREAKLQQQQIYDQLLRSLPMEKQELYKEAERHPKSRMWLEAEAIRRGLQNPGKKIYKNMYLLLKAIP